MLTSGTKVKLKWLTRASHACGNISVMPECSNQRTIYFVYIKEPELYILYSHFFQFCFFCMSDHIVLSDQNSDLAGHVLSIEKV